MSRAVSGPPMIVPLSSITPDADGSIPETLGGRSFRLTDFNGEIALGFLAFGAANAGVSYSMIIQPVAGNTPIPNSEAGWVDVGRPTVVRGRLEDLGEGGAAVEVAVQDFGDHLYGSVKVMGTLPVMDGSGGPATPSFLLFAVLTEPRRMSTPQAFGVGSGSSYTVADDLTVTVLSDADGTTPVSGATVEVVDALGEGHTLISDKDGLAVFKALPDDPVGVTQVRATKGAKVRTQFLSLMPPPDGGNTISMIPAADAGSLVVTVLDSSGDHLPVAGAQVSVSYPDGNSGAAPRTTGVDGTATFVAHALLAIVGATISANKDPDSVSGTMNLTTGANTKTLTFPGA